MKIIRQDLLDVLDKVEPALATKELLEQSTSFVFSNKKVITYNDEIAISCAVDLDIEAAVQGQQLHRLLKKMKDKELDIEVAENELIVKGKKVKAGIKLDAEIRLPIDEISSPGKWIPLPKRFLKGIKLCIFSASTDATRPKLICLHIEKQFIESCDNFRLTRFDMGKKAKKCFEKSILLPAKSARELIKYKPIEYSHRKGWIHFKIDNALTFSCRTFSDTYPDLDDLLIVEGIKLEIPANIKQIIERANIFSRADFQQDEQIEITIKKKRMTIKGQGELGWFKEKTKSKYNGEPIKFAINPGFLTDIIDILNEVTVSKNKIKLEAKNFIHVMALKATGRDDE